MLIELSFQCYHLKIISNLRKIKMKKNKIETKKEDKKDKKL
jgi:hypothetical protein